MSPPPSPPMRGCSALVVQTFEPIAWAEELIEPARAVDHPRLAFLYVIASLCYTTGRIEAAVGYADAGQIVLGRSREALPYGIEAVLGAVYLAIGQPERWVELCRAQLARRRDTHVHIRAWLVIALAVAGSGGEAMDSADGLIEAAEATGNPVLLAWALAAYGLAFRDADPVGALNALGRGLVIAQDSGNRAHASALAVFWHDLRPNTATPCPRSITSLWRSATTTMRATPRRSASRWPSSPLFSTGSDATNRRPPSPGSRSVPFAAAAVPEITTAITHLRDVLGEADLRIARPQGRDDDHRRHGDLRLRPNRPGPSRTERGLEEQVGAQGDSLCGTGPLAPDHPRTTPRRGCLLRGIAAGQR